jgi:hypothetical protein
MFIQLDCGCIGLLIKDDQIKDHFYQMIDCSKVWSDISFHESTSQLEHHRFRQLNTEETTVIIQLFQQAIADADGFETIQSALNLSNQKRICLRKNLDNVFVKYKTMKSVNAIDKPDIFPMDDRLETVRQSEIEYLNHLKERS